MRKPKDPQQGPSGAMVAVVIIVTMLAWLVVQPLGAWLNWPARFVFLFDLAAIAAFFWALVVTWQIWQRQKSGRDAN